MAAMENTASIAPMNLLLNALAHVLNATKSLATFALNQINVVFIAGVMCASEHLAEHLATLGKRRRKC